MASLRCDKSFCECTRCNCAMATACWPDHLTGIGIALEDTSRILASLARKCTIPACWSTRAASFHTVPPCYMTTAWISMAGSQLTVARRHIGCNPNIADARYLQQTRCSHSMEFHSRPTPPGTAEAQRPRLIHNSLRTFRRPPEAT